MLPRISHLFAAIVLNVAERKVNDLLPYFLGLLINLHEIVPFIEKASVSNEMANISYAYFHFVAVNNA